MTEYTAVCEAENCDSRVAIDSDRVPAGWSLITTHEKSRFGFQMVICDKHDLPKPKPRT